MKKKLSLLIAMLLSISMLLASCGDGSGGGYKPPVIDPGDPDGGKTPAELEQLANAGYAQAIAEWLKYITYNTPETDADLKLNKLEGADMMEGVIASQGDAAGKLMILSKTKNGVVSVEGEDGTAEHSYQNVTYFVYDIETGKSVLKLEGTNYDTGGNPYVYATDVDFSKHVTYELSLIGGGAVIEAAKTVFVLRPLTDLEIESETVLDPKEFDNYVEKTTYSYYDASGKLLAGELDATATERDYDDDDDDTLKLLDIGEYTYAVDTAEGVIIRRFDLGMELLLPHFRSGNARYAYFTNGQYHYMVIEQEMLVTQIGDLALATLPGFSIQILNESYEIVNEYVTDSYATNGYTVLPNGDVYVCEYEQLPTDAAEYDVLVGNQKMNVLHTVVSASVKGKTTSLDRAFVARHLYIETMHDVQTPFQAGTHGDFAGVCAMKAGYVLATLQKYEGGTLSSDSVIAVLDGELNIVAELPKILPNQFGYASFLDGDRLLLQCAAEISSAGSTLIYYTADAESGDVELYFERDGFGDYGSVEVIEGGYLYDGAVYDSEWNKLYTFSDSENYTFVEGKLIFISNGDCYFGKIAEYTSDDYYGDEYGDKKPMAPTVVKTFVKERFRSGYQNVLTSDNLIVSSDSSSVSIYNLNGEHLLSYRPSETVTVRDQDDPSLYVRYEITRHYRVNGISDECAVLWVTENCWIDGHSYASEDEIPNNLATQVYDTYYILK